MTSPEPFRCPACDGPQMVGHPAGRLTYQHTNQCSLRAHEDGQKVVDLDQALARFQRPATATERTLLVSQGFELPEPPGILLTRVDFWTRGVCRRTWPQLEETSS